ncbi:InlB B-repeat-containing protein [Candidatus Saccharibacteria bacterium]|nr:InlB B-repeat-containing protein [Candidatus Saccharibacteria bacterium]
MSLVSKLARILNRSNRANKPSESVSRRPGRDVRDSIQTKEGKCITSTGTFTLLIMLLALPILASPNTYATASSITVSVSSTGPIVMNVPPTKDGKFVSSNATTIGVTTNHASGYTLTATATDLSFTDTSVNPNVTHTIDTFTPPTGVVGINAATFAATDSTSTTNYNNKWGYLPSKYCTGSSVSSCVDNTTNQYYLPAPLTGQTLDITSTTSEVEDGTSNLIPTNYTVAIGARLDYTITQGAYTTNFTFAAVGNPTPYTITYYANDTADIADDGANTANMPPNHTASDTGSLGETVTIAPNAPVRKNYFFNGWCTVATTVDGACTGTTYYGNSTYTLDQTNAVANDLTLYAIWNTSTCAGKTNLHDLVTCQVKTTTTTTNGITTTTERTQTLADMQAVITSPITGDPATDTSNSGVYKYDASYYGAANDNPDETLNTEDIYYFRGALDSTYTTSDQYGGIPSTGDSAYYHNYVRLHDPNSNKADTCWRIVRTTATGGTKMIYNGVWDSSTCANTGSNAMAGKTYFNRGTLNYDADLYGTKGFVVYVGYSYNSDYAYNNTNYTSPIGVSEVFSNNNSSNTITASNARTAVENWYVNSSNLFNYNINSKLETSAGWCNDRSFHYDSATITPYGPSGEMITFNVALRNEISGGKMSLSCKNKTGYDLLATSNGYLEYPLSLLTADEAALVGHGYQTGQSSYGTIVTSSSNYSRYSYLRAATFWLLSPNYRGNGGGILVCGVSSSNGNSISPQITESTGIRPTISLANSTTITSGTGTSTDPWVIEP